jgi:hypothetical protein
LALLRQHEHRERSSHFFAAILSPLGSHSGNRDVRTEKPDRSAVIYSILLSCRRRGINPQNYLTDVLGRLPSMKITQIQELLPAYWKPPSANTS